ncbi:MAG: DUF3332 domain-containing protein [Prevotella sp.]|nr:DUF3332 domain-containing protein [Prevotella sp.]
MKRIKTLKITVCLLIGSFMFNSCIGSFGLFNQYAAWQKDMTDNKFINAIVGFFLMPIVGSVTLFVDAVVLNTIEFWTGDNPVASNIGKTQNIMGSDGVLYAVKTLRNGYEITAPSGEIVHFLYDKKNDSWSVSQNGIVKEVFRFNEDGKSIKVNVGGESRDFTLNEQGVNEAMTTVAANGRFFAFR